MQKINSSYQITAQNFLISLECLIWLCPANTFSVANTNAQTSGHPHIPYNLYPYTIYKARTNSPSHLAASTHINTNTKPYTQHWWYKVRARNRCARARSAKKPIINVYYGFSSAMHYTTMTMMMMVLPYPSSFLSWIMQRVCGALMHLFAPPPTATRALPTHQKNHAIATRILTLYVAVVWFPAAAQQVDPKIARLSSIRIHIVVAKLVRGLEVLSTARDR